MRAREGKTGVKPPSLKGVVLRSLIGATSSKDLSPWPSVNRSTVVTWPSATKADAPWAVGTEGWWGRRTANASESSKDSRCQTTTSFTGRNYSFYQNLKVCRVRLSSSLLSWNLHTFHIKNETCHPPSSKTILPPPSKDGVLCSAFRGAGLHQHYCARCRLPLRGQGGRRAGILGRESQWNQSVSNPAFRPCEDPPLTNPAPQTLTRQARSCSSFWDAESRSFPDSGPLTEKELLLQRQALLIKEVRCKKRY